MGALQIDRQLSWQLQLPGQQQQQQQMQAQMQAQQQQQQMLQLQQMETVASAAAQQLTSLKLELQQRQQAQEAQLLAAMVTSGLPASSLEVSNALMAQLPMSADMTCQGVDGSLLYVQNAPAAMNMQGLLDPAFAGIGSSGVALDGSGGILGATGVMLPSAAAAGAATGEVGRASFDLSTMQLPQGSQCYQVVQDAAPAAADSCMMVSEGPILQQQQQQQQQQQLLAAGGLTDVMVLPGQLQGGGYSGNYCI
jgi:hypothetical protein